jgi:hypothetical protein
MPKIKPLAAKDYFSDKINGYSRAHTGCSGNSLAEEARIPQSTFNKRMQEPGTTTLNEFCGLIHAGRLNDQEVVEIIRNQEELI